MCRRNALASVLLRRSYRRFKLLVVHNGIERSRQAAWKKSKADIGRGGEMEAGAELGARVPVQYFIILIAGAGAVPQV